MLDITTAQEGFKAKIIYEIGFVRSAMNDVGGLTKHTKMRALPRIVRDDFLPTEPEQRII